MKNNSKEWELRKCDDGLIAKCRYIHLCAVFRASSFRIFQRSMSRSAARAYLKSSAPIPPSP